MQGDWYLRPDGIPVLIDREGDEERIHDYEIMQFTGFTDSRGKEIYEGDVLQFWDDKEGENQAYSIIINFIRDTLALESRKASWKSVGVIGNIYQNPDLLK